MQRNGTIRLAALAAALVTLGSLALAGAGKGVTLSLRRRRPDAKGELRLVKETATLDPTRTAVVVVDMWDTHWCKTLAARTAALVPRMNQTLDAARRLGMPVVFMPSDTMAFYKDHPRRRAAAALARRAMPKPSAFHPPRPIGGGCCCDSKTPCKPGSPWRRQHAGIRIGGEDYVTDSAQELYNLVAGRGITHLLYMGVHTNMCVLYRPFGMIAMTRLGLKCILVRDLTDAATRFDPRGGVTPDSGTASVVAHIERHVAPSVASYDLLRAAGLAKAPPLRVVMLSGSFEYDSGRSTGLLKQYLEARHDMRCTVLQARLSDRSLAGLEALDDCDVMFLFTRRLELKGAALERFKAYGLAGRPIVGVRTASHAVQTWLALDKEVLGGSYNGHYGQAAGRTAAAVAGGADAEKHPVLAGVTIKESEGTLYKNAANAKDTTTLLLGSAGGHTHPIAWTREYKGARIFYTSLGCPKDFADAGENFLRLLANAIRWTGGRGKRGLATFCPDGSAPNREPSTSPHAPQRPVPSGKKLPVPFFRSRPPGREKGTGNFSPDLPAIGSTAPPAVSTGLQAGCAEAKSSQSPFRSLLAPLAREVRDSPSCRGGGRAVKRGDV